MVAKALIHEDAGGPGGMSDTWGGNVVVDAPSDIFQARHDWTTEWA